MVAGISSISSIYLVRLAALFISLNLEADILQRKSLFFVIFLKHSGVFTGFKISSFELFDSFRRTVDVAH